MADQTQYVTIGVANETFAAPVSKVLEILDVQPVSQLPRAPQNLLGMIDVRGAGVPVFDLRLTLGMPPADDTENTRIVVLSIEDGGRPRTMGLRADQVFEVTVLDSETLDPPPDVNASWKEHCIEGIGRRNGGFVTVLDLDRLLGAGAAALSAA